MCVKSSVRIATTRDRRPDVPDAQAQAFEVLRQHYERLLSEGGGGLGPHAVQDPAVQAPDRSLRRLDLLDCGRERPNKPHSYTNNWPPEELVGNHLTQEAVVWSALSIIALLGGTGVVLALSGATHRSLAGTRKNATLTIPIPSEVSLTPAQRTTAWYFFIVAALFCVQTLVGAAAAHYHAETGGFFGYDLASVLPYNLARTWHLQLGLFWVVASFLAAGIYLAPVISGSEPRGQSVLSVTLLAALVVVVVGTLIARCWDPRRAGGRRSNVRAQGWEYLDLARLYQVLLTVGLVIWVFMFRGAPLAAARRAPRQHAVPVLPGRPFGPRLLRGRDRRTRDDFTITEFWRFWVVHLWVEDFLELFTTVMVAYIFVLLGVVLEKTAMTVIYLDIVLYSVGGVIGTMHHLYFSGEPAEHMALGAFFSAAEVIPLTFLTVEAWSFLQLGSARSRAHRRRFRTAGRSCSWCRSASGTSSAPASSGS